MNDFINQALLGPLELLGRQVSPEQNAKDAKSFALGGNGKLCVSVSMAHQLNHTAEIYRCPGVAAAFPKFCPAISAITRPGNFRKPRRARDCTGVLSL